MRKKNRPLPGWVGVVKKSFWLSGVNAMIPSIVFDVGATAHTVSLPEPGNTAIRSVFLIGLPKAGSTLLNLVMQPLCVKAGLSAFSLHNTFHNMGITARDYPTEVDPLFVEYGYAYLGFRTWIARHAMPRAADGRVIFLVRDPRDMVVSLFFSQAFSHRPPGGTVGGEAIRKFEERRRAIAGKNINEFVLEVADTVSRGYAATVKKLETVGHKIWRYEDVIFEKQRWVEEMLDYLDLNVPDAMVKRVVRRHDLLPDAEEIHRHVRKVTPGDHRNKLSEGTIAKLNSVFSDILGRFDYD